MKSTDAIGLGMYGQSNTALTAWAIQLEKKL